MLSTCESSFLLIIIRVALFKASFIGAMAIADLVKTTLGPKGMVNLILVSDDISMLFV